MQNILKHISKPKYLLSSFGGVLLCLVGFTWLEKTLGLSILDTLPSYDLAIVKQNMIGYGEEGRIIYAWASLTLDTLFPLCYATFFAGLIVLLAGKGSLRWLSLLPFILGLVDLGENIQIFSMLVQFPQITEYQVNFASSTTLIKHSIVKAVYALIALLAVYALLKLLIQRFKKQGSLFKETKVWADSRKNL